MSLSPFSSNVSFVYTDIDKLLPSHRDWVDSVTDTFLFIFHNSLICCSFCLLVVLGLWYSLDVTVIKFSMFRSIYSQSSVQQQQIIYDYLLWRPSCIAWGIFFKAINSCISHVTLINVSNQAYTTMRWLAVEGEDKRWGGWGGQGWQRMWLLPCVLLLSCTFHIRPPCMYEFCVWYVYVNVCSCA